MNVKLTLGLITVLFVGCATGFQQQSNGVVVTQHWSVVTDYREQGELPRKDGEAITSNLSDGQVQRQISKPFAIRRCNSERRSCALGLLSLDIKTAATDIRSEGVTIRQIVTVSISQEAVRNSSSQMYRESVPEMDAMPSSEWTHSFTEFLPYGKVVRAFEKDGAEYFVCVEPENSTKTPVLCQSGASFYPPAHSPSFRVEDRKENRGN